MTTRIPPSPSRPSIPQLDRPPMPRPLQPTPAMMMPRRPTRVGPEPTRVNSLASEMALVDELSELLTLDEHSRSDRIRPDEFRRPSWCTHAGVTVARGDRRTCLRCGAVLS